MSDGNGAPVIEVRDLTCYFTSPGLRLLGRPDQVLKAVDGATFTIRSGETLGLVGESGSGKSTLGRALLRLIEPTGGQVIYEGTDVGKLTGGEMRAARRHMQMVFQDPYASLDPRMRVGSIIREPLDIYGIGSRSDREERVRSLAQQVGLGHETIKRFPHQLSGGQRQRVGIAAALALGPNFIIADEPTSALDVSVQAQILNLLSRLQQAMKLSMLFISHNLGVIEHVSDRIAVMYLGRIVEIAPKRQIFTSPQHPYTEALLAAVPSPDPRNRGDHAPLAGEIPSPLDPPPGCPFHPRCPHAIDICRSVTPQLQEYAPGSAVACHVALSRLSMVHVTPASSQIHPTTVLQGD